MNYDAEPIQEPIPGELSTEQKAAIFEQAEKSATTLQERIDIGNKLVEETFAKNKEEAIRIKELEEELKTKNNQEILDEADIDSLQSGLKSFREMSEKYNIDQETVITDLGEESESTEHRYRFSDVEAMQPGKLFKANKKGPYLAMLGAMALYSGIDISKGLPAKEIISRIESLIKNNQKAEAGK